MLLRLLGLVVLSTLCSSMLYYPPQVDKNATDNTKVYNGVGDFSDKEPSPGGGRGLGKSMIMPPSNYSFEPSFSALPGDMSVMFPDTSICDVLLNSPIPISISEIPFFCLCSHCKATTGPKGERGDQGLTGTCTPHNTESIYNKIRFSGSPGRRGLMGFRGPRGFTGALGTKGQTGDQGDKGQPGRIGLTGIKGEQGFKGDKGDFGDDGLPGPLGLQGVPGSCLCEIVSGLPGVQGSPGPAGARGLPGTTGSKGSVGDKGDKGDTGLDGSHGLDGLKGKQGSPGPCNCTNGVNGTNGQKGLVGEKGQKGNVGVEGLQGDTGLKGELGDPGNPGFPGPCSLSVQSAFSVALAASFPEPYRPVKFTQIISNVQSHYNPAIGLYIAPANGTYAFNFHLLVKQKRLIAGLFLNFNSVFKLTELTNTRTSSAEIVLRLKAGDMVWVQVKDSTNNGMFAGEDMSSTFSGWLLSPDSCDFGGIRDFNAPNVTGLEFPWN
ncbi:uncharacterized protein [Eucyclogobius newberryi]|uniref:uncharacterized protein n=1 Tax=Eucyclogobius newberryi TaxID=166745 RepID=UPI003B5C23F7